MVLQPLTSRLCLVAIRWLSTRPMHVVELLTKEDIGIEQQQYEIGRGKNFALNCLS